jgi:flavin reductase (DIM6/NTAB) family NADH-FMN oxidoreductase RutF
MAGWAGRLPEEGMSTIDPRRLRDACGHFGTGVTVVTTHCDGVDHGMTVNAFMSISLEPPLIAVSIAETARMLSRIRKSGRFAVSVLAETMDEIAWHFAGKINPKFTDLLETVEGLPVIRDAVAAFVADVVQDVVAGDHTIFVGRVRSLAMGEGKKPLLFFKGKFGGLAATEPAPVDFLELDRELIW